MQLEKAMESIRDLTTLKIRLTKIVTVAIHADISCLIAFHNPVKQLRNVHKDRLSAQIPKTMRPAKSENYWCQAL
jgi:hypothetical protein